MIIVNNYHLHVWLICLA